MLCIHLRIFETQNYINTVGGVDRVCLAPDRKGLKTPLNVVMSLTVV
jgi:hypothetical protein